MKRYSIMVQEFGSDREVELCQVNENPERVIDALAEKTLMIHTGKTPGNRRSRIPKYTTTRVVDHQVEVAS